MNIGMVTTWYKRGVSYQSRFLAACLKDGFGIHILAHKKLERDRSEEDRYKIDFKKAPSPGDIIDWIRKNDLKLVFFPDRFEDDGVLRWCAENGVRTVMIINHETIKPAVFGKLRLYTTLLCPVKCTFDLLSKNGFANIKFIRWGVDEKLFSPAPSMPGPPVMFLHNAGFGGASFRKNTEAVLLAFDRASRHNSDIKLVLKSQKAVSEYPEAVGKIAGANKRVIVMDREMELDRMLELYRSCHVSVLPSKFEGIGLPFLESMAAGLPVITVDAPPMNEWVKDGFNGYCCRVRSWEPMSDPELLIRSAEVDIDDLAEKMLKLSDVKTVEGMRRNAISTTAGSMERFRSEIVKLTTDLIGGKK